jgi:hypothetical protein
MEFLALGEIYKSPRLLYIGGAYMHKSIVITFIAILFLLAACGPAQTPATTSPSDDVQPSEPAASPTVKADSRVVNDDVNKMMAKASAVKSYRFTLAKLPEKSGTHIYSVKGTKIRVDPLAKLYYTQDIDVVYLDTVAKTATGYCLPEKGCNDKNVAIELEYNDWIIPLPTEWIDQAKYGKTAGTLTFFDRPVTRVRYEGDDQYYEVYVDNYYGFPLRIAVATDADMGNIISGYEYRSIAYNTVTDADVVYKPFTV